MPVLTRREFSKLVAAAPLAARAAGSMPVRPLGAIGFEAGIFGFGAQRIDGTEQSIVDRIVAEGIEQGLNYIDTAPNYGDSEERMGRALKGRRDKVFLVTKIETATKKQAAAQVRESLRRLQTDRLDAVLFHNLARTDRWPSFEAAFSEEDGAIAALLEARRQGLVRHIGCSTHGNPARMMQALATGHIELMMCVLNFVDHHIYHMEEKVLPELRRRKVGIIAMKVLGGPRGKRGAFLEEPRDYRATMRYVWGIPGVAVSIVGCRTPEELRQGIAAARAFRPLTAKETRELDERGKALAAQWGPSRGPVS